jgi:aspartyl-tRNA(Asn)/glutamyl-tRNA(Gln) amidotransferase subunit A
LRDIAGLSIGQSAASLSKKGTAMTRNWLTQTASELGRGIATGQIDPAELTECYLDAIAQQDLSPRIYARTTPDRARAEAMAAAKRAKSGQRLGPLDGVPISWKDLFDTAGTVTEAGSALLKGRTPVRDARVLQNATRAGLVCLGKTHMSELAFSGLGLNPVTATPPCVNDLAAVSGGSSSGAAASVAFGLAAAGIGSDTGGSVRIPAAWNDLVGLKTTSGLLSLDGVVPLCARFDTVGPLTRSVEDAAQLLAALSGTRAPDLTGADLSGRRFLICQTVALDDLDDAPAQAFEKAIERLSRAGATIEQGAIPSVAEAMPLAGCLYTTEAYGQWHKVIEANPDLMFDEILARFRSGRDFTGYDFVAGWLTLDRLRQEYRVSTAGYDAVLVPSAPILPPDAARLTEDHVYYTRANLLALRNTRIGNLLDLASLTLPTDQKSCGVMLLGHPHSEARLLRLGAAMAPLLRS